MPSQPESKLVNRIKSVLKVKHGCFVIKIHGGPYQQAGIPDLVGSYKGTFFGLEVKMPDKLDTVTKLQQTTIQEIRDSGAYAEVISSVEEAEEMISFLDAIDTTRPKSRGWTQTHCPNCGRSFADWGSVNKTPEESAAERLCIPCHNGSTPPEEHLPVPPQQDDPPF